MVYLHPTSLSPDPTYGRGSLKKKEGGVTMPIHPHALARVHPRQTTVAQWAKQFDLARDPGKVTLRGDAEGRADLVIDFGTELEAELELSLDAPACHVFVSFGESLVEAETWGIPTTNPTQTLAWRIDCAGRHTRLFPARGYRFIRLQFHDLNRAVTITRLVSRAWFGLGKQRGDFLCSDRSYQRAWQTAVYTARLCTRKDRYWDGIKRDRWGWFGDARLVQEATDLAYHDPAPALAMLEMLPTDSWVTGIPGFSFDAAAMLRQLVLFHGVNLPNLKDRYTRVKKMLEWAAATQATREGWIKRDPVAKYFGEIAFLDWSPMPMGGKFEELGWLQAKHLEAIRNAGTVARWMGLHADAEMWTRKGDALAQKIRQRFWRSGRGLVHTLNQTTRKWEALLVLDSLGGKEWRSRYFDNPPLGESGPSRHSNALAMWAGLVSSDETTMLRRVFDSKLPALITPYFMYYEQCALAMCGGAATALKRMRDYVVEQIEWHDSATVWEWYDPAVQDFRKWYMGDWPKSLCHGWGGGLATLTNRYLLGVEPIAPGMCRIKLDPTAPLGMSFHATMPTHHGLIRIRKEAGRRQVQYDVPSGIEVEQPTRAVIDVRQR